MALSQELLGVLNNEEEPLKKRLKIADGVFNSTNLSVHNKEALLLIWAGTTAKNNNVKVWELLHKWLSSDHLKEIGRVNLKRDDAKELLQTLIESTQALELLEEDVKNLIVKSVSELLDNKRIRDLFKCDIENYYKLVVQVLLKVDLAHLQLFLKKKHLFDNTLLINEENAKFFIKYIIPTLGEIAGKFEGNEMIFHELSNVLQTFFYFQNAKNFESFYNHVLDNTEQQSLLPNLLFSRFPKFSQSKYGREIFRLIFISYNKSYGNKPEMIFKFFLVATNYLGFYKEGFLDPNPADQKLLQVTTALCQFFEILSQQNLTADPKIKELTFNSYIEELLMSIIYYVNSPDRDCFKLIQHFVAIDPLIIEKHVKEVIVFVILSQNSCPDEAEITLNILFEVFQKLNRIPNLISKMIESIKFALKEKELDYEPNIVFCGYHDSDIKRNYNANQILTENILTHFMSCVTTLAHWQIINVFKTLLHHLGKAIDKALKRSSDIKLFYIEFVSIFLSRFLCSVKVAENTTPDNVLRKFVGVMEQLRTILEKFGTSLVQMKHCSSLMKMYLDICYYWAELYIVLEYYSMNNLVFTKKSNFDLSACNITYLHSYLNKEQWCLISERIANFGEKPCKEVMQKLFIQKLRAILLFENTDGEELRSSLSTSLSVNLDENWENLLSEDFTVEEIVTKMDFSNVLIIAELLFDDILQKNHFNFKKSILNYPIIRNSLLYVCLKKINSIFKQRRKLDDSFSKKSLSVRLFKNISSDMFNSQPINDLIEFFNNELTIENQVSLCLNKDKLHMYLDILKQLYITYDSNEIILCTIMYLSTILLDLHNVPNEEIKSKINLIIKALLQNYSGSLQTIQNGLFSSDIRNSPGFMDWLPLIVDIMFKEGDLGQLNTSLDILFRNLQSHVELKYRLIVFNTTLKYKKTKTLDKKAFGEFQLNMFNKMLQLLKDVAIDDEIVTEAYAVLLKYAFSNENGLNVDLLVANIPTVVKSCEKSKEISKGDVMFFTFLIRHESQIKADKNLVSQIWSNCKESIINFNEFEISSELIVLIFEHISNEQFGEITENLLNLTLNGDNESLPRYLRVWKAVLTCSFNPVKGKIWAKTLEKLLEAIIFHTKWKSDDFCQLLTELETKLIQSVHLLLTPTLLDLIFVSISLITNETHGKFLANFLQSHSLMFNLIKYRKQPLMDCLPSFLQQYRNLLQLLCKKSNSDLPLTIDEMEECFSCSHKMEKLTNSLVECNKHIVRLCPYLIAEILKKFEQVTLLPNVKMHLDNCIYSFLSLCDEHAIAYITRIMSLASIEMFKGLYTNYKKYYKFTGKV